MRHPQDHARVVGFVARAAALVALSALLAGCISIPQRAWSNSAGFTNSRAYQRVMGGDMSFSTRRDLQTAVNFGSLGFYQDGPAFSPFPKGGSWR